MISKKVFVMFNIVYSRNNFTKKSDLKYFENQIFFYFLILILCWPKLLWMFIFHLEYFLSWKIFCNYDDKKIVFEIFILFFAMTKIVWSRKKCSYVSGLYSNSLRSTQNLNSFNLHFKININFFTPFPNPFKKLNGAPF